MGSRRGKFLVFVVGIMALSGATSGAGWFDRGRVKSASEVEFRLRDSRDLNRRMLRWANDTTASLDDWLKKRGQTGGPPEYIDYYLVDKNPQLRSLRPEEASNARATKVLFDELYSPAIATSALHTFIESGNPVSKTGFQWDSHHWSGLSDPADFEKMLVVLKGNPEKPRIENLRLGFNLFELDLERPESWKNVDDKMAVLKRQKIGVTLTVDFFASLARFKTTLPDGTVDYLNSYHLHPDWPAFMEKITSQFVKRYGAQIKMINPINEPETAVGFNGVFWHGGYPGDSSPEQFRYYVLRAIRVGKAAVRSRIGAELASPGARLLFMHNEAMTPEYYSSHGGAGRFAVSKFMLGDDCFLKADFRAMRSESVEELRARLDSKERGGKLNELEWAFSKFVFGSWNKTAAERAKAKAELIAEFEDLKRAHEELARVTAKEGHGGKNMRTDTVLALDYYYQTEYQPLKTIDQLLAEFHDEGSLRYALGMPTHEALLQLVGGKTGEAPLEVLARNNGKRLKELLGLRPSFSRQEAEKYMKELGSKRLMAILGVKTHADFIRAVGAKKRESALHALSRDDYIKFIQLFALDIKPGNGELTLNFEPQFYPRQVRAGVRHGFHALFTLYAQELGIYTVAVGESGTPFHVFAPLLHDQVMLEYAAALRAGLYGTFYSPGPAVHTRGWAREPLGLSIDEDNAVNPSGMMAPTQKQVGGRLENIFEVMPWVPALDEVLKKLAR